MNQIRTWLYWLISALMLSGATDVFAKFQNTSVNAAIFVNSQRTERHAEYYRLELGILTEYSDLGSPLSILRTYTWGLDLSGTSQGAGGVGGLLMVSDGASTQTHHFTCFDGNGNIVALINAADGSVTARYEYGPFGEIICITGPSTGSMAKSNPFRFSTKYSDDETDLVYYGHRYYSASLGRWISRDPIQEQGGMNLYGFVGNNAITWFDLLGLLDENGMSLLNDLNAKMALLVRQRALLESERSTRLLKNLGSACRGTKIAIDKARDVFYASENDISYAYHVLKAREYQVNLCDTSSLLSAADLEYRAGRIADWIQEQFERTNEILSGDGQSVIQNWVVNVYTDTAYRFLVDPYLKFGASAGTAAGSPITFGSIALAATEETFRLANVVAIGSAAYLRAISATKSICAGANAAEETVTLYHGTTTSAARNIFNGGFRAGADKCDVKSLA